MRVGKNVEHFKAAATAADAKNMDPVLKYCAVGRQLGYAMYLTFDLATYVSTVLVFDYDNLHIADWRLWMDIVGCSGYQTLRFR